MPTARRSLLKRLARLAATTLGMAGALLAGHALLARRRPRYPANPPQYPPIGKRLIRPPGAAEEPSFLAGCIRCYRCQDACEPGAIQFFSEAYGRHYHTPYVDPSLKACTICMKCTQVCPTGVLAPMVIEQKTEIVMGSVELDTDRCLSYKAEARYDQRASNWEVKLTPSLEPEELTLDPDADLKRRGACGECYTVCPVRERAVKQKPGSFLAPLIFPDACIGCGLCEEICRQVIRGEPAIRVVATRGDV
jgi:ferredoxin